MFGCSVMRTLCLLSVPFCSTTNGDEECWIGTFTWETCCKGEAGIGNSDCWDGKSYTFQRCCGSDDQSRSQADIDVQVATVNADSTQQVRSSGGVLFNDQLTSFVESIRIGLAEHALLEAQGLSDCSADGTVRSALLRDARQEVVQALHTAAEKDSDGTFSLLREGLLVEQFYKDPGSLLQQCPQAVLQGSAAYLDRTLANIHSACTDLSVVRMCQHSTPFMFDPFIYHVVLKHAVIELYSAEQGRRGQNANVTQAQVFRGWPLAEHERRVWTRFSLLWRTIWDQRDFCSCVEGYDYYATMHALFDQTLQLSRKDFAIRTLQSRGTPRRVIDVADHCEEWLDKDFLRLFSAYAKLSACIPGAIMENIVCMHRWILNHHVVGALNTAEMMVKLMTLSGDCLDTTNWPFSRDDVQHNFAMLALHWQEADVGCSAINRFGEKLSRGICPEELSSDTLRRLLWKPSPLVSPEPSAEEETCVIDIVEACIVHGTVVALAHIFHPVTHTVSLREVETDKWGLRVEPALESCSETGRNRYAIQLASRERLHELDVSSHRKRSLNKIAFVLNVPIFADNIWHNVHWLVPAVARLHRDSSIMKYVPHSVDLILAFAGYSFTETPPELFPSEGTRDQPQEMQKPTPRDPKVLLEAFAKLQQPFLQLLSSDPPQCLELIRHKCYQKLLWGHPEMRADRELTRVGAVGRGDLDLFRVVLKKWYGRSMESSAQSFWGITPESWEKRPITIAMTQRDVGHGRSFYNVNRLTAVGLEPLAVKGRAIWRLAGYLGKLPLVDQAAIFSSADVMVGAVGAALGWLIVMRPGATVLEWLPQGVPPMLYRCSEAWNADSLGMFGGLGRLSGVNHVCLRSESQAVSMSDKRQWSGLTTIVSENYWRNWDLHVDPRKFSRWVMEAVRRAEQTRPRLTLG